MSDNQQGTAHQEQQQQQRRETADEYFIRQIRENGLRIHPSVALWSQRTWEEMRRRDTYLRGTAMRTANNMPFTFCLTIARWLTAVPGEAVEAAARRYAEEASSAREAGLEGPEGREIFIEWTNVLMEVMSRTTFEDDGNNHFAHEFPETRTYTYVSLTGFFRNMSLLIEYRRRR